MTRKNVVNVTIQGGGSVSVDPPTGPYEPGTIVTLSAVPTSGWLFGSWSGDATGGANPLELVMDGNKAVLATFAKAGGTGSACGIGPELVAAIPLLAWLRGRRRRTSPRSA